MIAAEAAVAAVVASLRIAHGDRTVAREADGRAVSGKELADRIEAGEEGGLEWLKDLMWSVVADEERKEAKAEGRGRSA